MTYVINPSLFGAAAATLLLDESGLGSAHGAYSVARKLRSAYAGSCIRVRRASDSTEQDIGFSGNALDTAALQSFCSGTNGFVVTVYDQSGNAKNATQSTTTKQPQIVASGSVITDNGKPAAQFDNDDFLLYNGGTVSAVQSGTLLAVMNADAGNGANFIKSVVSYGDASTPVALRSGRFGTSGDSNKMGIVNASSAQAALSAAANTAQMLGIGFWAASKKRFYENNNAYVENTAESPSEVEDDIAIGAKSDGSVPFASSGNTATIQEAVVWTSDLEANVATIKSNVNGFYSIY